MYQESSPSAPLQPYVEGYWNARLDRGTGARELLIPDGTAQLLFVFGAGYRSFDQASGGQGVPTQRSHLLRPRCRGVFIEQHGAEDVFAVRFRPGGMHALLGIPMTELTHASVDAESALGTWAVDLEARLSDAGSPSERAQVADGLLLDRLAGRDLPDRRLRAAVARIFAGGGAVRVGLVAERVGMGRRQLDRAFARAVGLTPKRLARIVRVDHALLRIQRDDGSLASVAHAVGYADQAHMVREFQALVGMTPGALLQRRYVIVEAARPAMERRLSETFKTFA